MNDNKYRLPKEFAQRWILALRSGQYGQCQSELAQFFEPNQRPNYCCIGVAGAINGVTDFTDKDGVPQGFPNGLKADNVLLYPEELIGETGLSEELATLNDSGESFENIADWIEENVEFYE